MTFHLWQVYGESLIGLKERPITGLGLILLGIETFDVFYYLKIGIGGLLEKITKSKKHIMALLCRK